MNSSLNNSWDFRRNPSTQIQSTEDLSDFYRRLGDTQPTVSPISIGSFHSGLSPILSSRGSQFTVEAEPIPLSSHHL
ncbi:hypothetical protein J6590_043571 [Homalodisca vitripennis]|nr:hypothetical protein J6590_043571 [Homalodisca vitripennis]